MTSISYRNVMKLVSTVSSIDHMNGIKFSYGFMLRTHTERPRVIQLHPEARTLLEDRQADRKHHFYASHLLYFTLKFTYSCPFSLSGSCVADFMDGDCRTGGC